MQAAALWLPLVPSSWPLSSAGVVVPAFLVAAWLGLNVALVSWLWLRAGGE